MVDWAVKMRSCRGAALLMAESFAQAGVVLRLLGWPVEAAVGAVALQKVDD